MGAGDLYAITKGPIHTAIEVCVNEKDDSNNYAKRDRFLQALQEFPQDQDCSSDFVRILKEIAQVTEEAAKYLETKWLTWWSADHPHREPIIRYGIIRAINAANTPPKVPIDFYWLSVGNRDSKETYPFETIVTRSQWQVNCLLVTPPSPEDPDPAYVAKLTDRADIWTVKAKISSDLQPAEERWLEPNDRLIITRAKTIPLTDSMHSPAVRPQG
jgi:hypothetical protein